MQRWTALVFLAFVAVAVGALVVDRRTADGASGASSASSGAVVLAPLMPSVRSPLGLAAPPREAPGDPTPPRAEDPLANGAPGSTGSHLSASAPRSVTFGVVLVAYRGAQGAPADARTREEAQALAAKVAEKATTDFAAAVKLGDIGYEDAGEMPREVLEAPAEQVLFGLKPGEVGGPVDSPRGYYVFRRIE